MHVLMLPSWYPEEADDLNGSFFREQAEALVRAGLRVGVLAVRGVSLNEPLARSREMRRPPIESVENGVVVVRANALRPVPLAHRLNLAVLEARWRRVFEDYTRRHGVPDVLHAHTLNPAGVAARSISEATGIPFVVTEHRPESALRDSESRTLRDVLSRAQRDARGLLAVSPAFASALNLAYGSDRWDSIPNLLPPQFEAAPPQPPQGPLVFGHVSDLSPRKRVDLLLEAFRRAFGVDEEVRLRIIGDSEYRAELEERARELGLVNVDFVGNVPRSGIVEEFSKFHTFVLPSSAESFGVVFWEAMACGQPIIATDTDGGRLAVSDGAGYLVPIDDLDALTGRLRDMRRNIDGFDREAIRARSIRECGFDSFTRCYRDVYDRAIAAASDRMV